MTQPRFYIVTDRTLAAASHGGLSQAVARAIESLPPGSASVQLREKDLPESALIALARELGAVCRERDVPLFINGSARAAALADAQGVHFPEASSEADIRRAKHAGLRVGVSVHGPGGAARARRCAVDLVVAGPVFDTPSKRGFGPPIGLDGLAEVTSVLGDIPVYAIGGIDSPARAQAVGERGAAGVAGIRVFLAENIPFAQAGCAPLQGTG